MGKNSISYYDDDEEELLDSRKTRNQKKKHKRRRKNNVINQINSDYKNGLIYDEDFIEDLMSEMNDEES